MRQEQDAAPAARRPRTIPAGAWLLGALVLAAACGLWWRARRPAQAPGERLRDLLPAIARGEAGAVERARGVAEARWDESLPALQEMLRDDRWRLRAAACEIVQVRRDPRLVGVLLGRASDRDWHVRAAACEALGRFRAFRGTVLRDVPLDGRERALLQWLDAWDARASAPLGDELCELYAEPDHLEVGRPISRRCLSCHAGDSRDAAPADERAAPPPDTCAACHKRIHAEWSASAHAQRLSHLRLMTIDPRTREVRVMDCGRTFIF